MDTGGAIGRGGGKWIGRAGTILGGIGVILQFWSVYEDYKRYQEAQRIPFIKSEPSEPFKWNSSTNLDLGGFLEPWPGSPECEPSFTLGMNFSYSFGAGENYVLKQGLNSLTPTSSYDVQQQLNNLPAPSNQLLAKGDIVFQRPNLTQIVNGGNPSSMGSQRPQTQLIYRYEDSRNTSNKGAWQSFASTWSRYVQTGRLPGEFFDRVLIDAWSIQSFFTINNDVRRTMRENGFTGIEIAAGYFDPNTNRFILTPEWEIE